MQWTDRPTNVGVCASCAVIWSTTASMYSSNVVSLGLGVLLRASCCPCSHLFLLMLLLVVRVYVFARELFK